MARKNQLAIILIFKPVSSFCNGGSISPCAAIISSHNATFEYLNPFPASTFRIPQTRQTRYATRTPATHTLQLNEAEYAYFRMMMQARREIHTNCFQIDIAFYGSFLHCVASDGTQRCNLYD